MKQTNPNPRICLLTDSFHPIIGGGETHALLLCREWLKNNVPVFVMTRRIKPEFAREENLDGLTIVRVAPSGFSRFGKYLMTIPTFFELIQRRDDYDVLYVCSFRVAGIPALLAALCLRKPCILRAESRGEFSGDFIWNSPDPAIRRSRGKPLIRLYIKIRNLLFSKAPAFVSISGDIHNEYLKGGIPEAKIRLIYNGIDTSKFAPCRPDLKAQLRRELGLPQDRKIFVYTGKLNQGKGLEMLLRAWKVIAGERNDCTLVLVGGGGGQFLSCEQVLRDFATSNQLLDSVIFAGFQTAVGTYLQAADYFVFPSENEALSIALLEALSSELPALASDISGNRDIVEDGVSGTLLPVNDEAAWISGIRSYLSNPAKAAELGRCGRVRVMDHFSIARVAEEHLKLFRPLLESTTGRKT